MRIHCVQTLSPAEKAALKGLVSACRQAEPITFSLPDDGEYYLWIARPGQRPLACLILCPVAGRQWECYAFTRPENRRQGLFSRLYACARKMTGTRCPEEEPVLLFLSDGQSPDAQAALKAMGMEPKYAEYQMERSLSVTDSARFLSLSCQSGALRIIRRRFREQGTEGWLYLGFLPSSGEKRSLTCPGTCRILPYGGGRFYLYHLEIAPKFRSKGLGRAFLLGILSRLPGNSRVILQVSSANAPALSLYKKTGFSVVKTLSYYSPL